jgi:hypothetical protein
MRGAVEAKQNHDRDVSRVGLQVDASGNRRSYGLLHSRVAGPNIGTVPRQPVDRARAVENAKSACASSEGWRVQWESDPPR